MNDEDQEDISDVNFMDLLPTVKVVEKTHKAALVNTETGFVENVIVVNSLDDEVQAGYVILPITVVDMSEDFTEEQLELIETIKQIDPDYKLPTKEIVIELNKTKWSQERGFYSEEE
jgi:hypothetical protein